MEPAAWLLFLTGAFVAEVIGTMAGFGAATVLTPIAACFMDIKIAIAVVACFHLFGNGSRLLFFGRHIHWRTWAQFGITGVLASLVGAAVTAQLPSSMVKLAFGLFLLLYVALSSDSLLCRKPTRQGPGQRGLPRCHPTSVLAQRLSRWCCGRPWGPCRRVTRCPQQLFDRAAIRPAGGSCPVRPRRWSAAGSCQGLWPG